MDMSKTLTRSDLIDSIHNEIGLSRVEASDILERFLEEVMIRLIRGEDVQLSSFGNFDVRYKKERMGRNPKTGILARISARRVVSFHASNVLKQKVNGEYM